MNNFKFKIDYDYKSRLTLIIDGNWLLMSRLAVLRGKYNDVQELFPILKENMIKSIAIVLNQIKLIDNVIFVADGGSWRKNIKRPPSLIEDDREDSYKGNRVKTADFDWKTFFCEYNKFTDEMATVGKINVFRHNDVEGDDWCWYISNALYNSGTNCIIMSADKDLTQLVKFNTDTYNFVMTYYKVKSNKHLITYHKTLDDYKEAVSMSFFLNQNNKYNLDCVKECLGVATETKAIEPNDIIIDKIFRGDVSDNILPPIYYRSGAKTYKITQKQLDYNIKAEDDEALKKFINKTITENVKYKSFDNSIVTEHAMYNRKLVYLDQSAYPEEILKYLQENAYYRRSKDLDIEMNYIRANKNKTTEFLDSL